MAKVFVFDVGGVLWDFRPLMNELITNWAKLVNLEATAFWQHYEAAYQEFELNPRAWPRWWQNQFPKIKVSRARAILNATFRRQNYGENYFNQPLIALIQQLKQEYTVGILSNVEAFLLPVYRHLDQVSGHFDFQILSCQVGARKPDPAIYRAIFKFGAWQKKDILYWDDKPENVLAAQKFGLLAFHYPPFLNKKALTVNFRPS